MDGFDLPRIKADYDTLGFAIVPGFLVGPELREAQQQAERYFMEIAPTKPDSEAFYLDRNDPSSIVQAHEMFELPYFRELPWNHNFLALAKLCGGTQEIAPMNVKHTQDGKRYAGSMELHNKGPGGRCVPSPPHQDNWYFNKIGGEVPTVWVALEDIDELNGCLRYVPGTHRQPLRTHSLSRVKGFSQKVDSWEPEDLAAEVPCKLAAGDALVHHVGVLHRAEPNKTNDRWRRVMAIVYEANSCTLDATGYLRYLAVLRESNPASWAHHVLAWSDAPAQLKLEASTGTASAKL